MKMFLLSIFMVLMHLKTLCQLQIVIPREATGYIDINHRIYGSGFVLNDVHYVVTCAHVLFDTTANLAFLPVPWDESNPPKPHKLKILKIFPEYDLALLASQDSICDKPWYSDSSFSFNPKEALIYVGFDTKKSGDSALASVINIGYVSNVEKRIINADTIHYVEFQGNAMPGYSGGPVIRGTNGKVVALIREGDFRIEDQNGQHPNRAFDIRPLVNYQYNLLKSQHTKISN